MRKFIVITLSCVIVLLSFAFCFADVGSPVILPVASEPDEGIPITYTSGQIRYYRSNESPVYLVFYNNGNNNSELYFSESSSAVVEFNIKGQTSETSHALDSQYNGYYFKANTSLTPTQYMLDGVFSSPEAVIDYVNDTVFSTTFSVTYLIDGSISWLSSLAQAVKDNGLLLFFVLFIFVGVGFGLFRRFTN